MNLIVKLLIGITLGIAVGYVAPIPLVQSVLTLKVLFGQFLSFVIPLLIFCFIAEGIANLRVNAGKMLGATTGLAYASTLFAGILAAFVALQVIPTFDLALTGELAKASVPKPFVELALPPVMSITTALVMAFLWGMGVASTRAPILHQMLGESKRIIELLVNRIILPALPFYIASLFVEMTVAGEVLPVLETFGLVLMLAVALHWVWLLVLYTVASLVTGTSLIQSFKNMFSAYFTAVGTMSSVATIPVTLQQTIKNGVDEDVADFVIPLCATIHLSGSTITLTTAAIAVMMLTQGALPTWDMLLPFIAMLGVTMVAAPGVPGGAVMAALGLFGSMLGFSESALALMIALYVAQDSFGTACNVTGDGAIALLVNRIVGKRDVNVIRDAADSIVITQNEETRKVS